MALLIGDIVSIPQWMAGSDLDYMVIGEPHYSRDGSHVVITAYEGGGMPINAEHCRVVRTDDGRGRQWREAFERRTPAFLRPQSSQEGSNGTA